ncbi:hypothetical protein ROZALSC1DRAFT_29964, partial [Rozella allomycis CSF55]
MMSSILKPYVPISFPYHQLIVQKRDYTRYSFRDANTLSFSFAHTRLYQEDIQKAILRRQDADNIVQMVFNKSVAFVTFSSKEKAINALKENLIVQNVWIPGSLCSQEKFKLISNYLELQNIIKENFNDIKVEDCFVMAYASAIH